MTDILLVTIECVRDDYRQQCPVYDDLDTVTGIATGTYTRPSLASLLSGQFDAAMQTRVIEPTLPGVLQDAGYATAGFADSPQTARSFGFGQGFDRYETVDDDDSGPLGRGSRLRERLASIGPVRRLYRRVQSKNATLENIRRDEQVIDDALKWWDVVDSPRFLWVHLMGSHRPYGWENPLPAELGRNAANADSRLLFAADHKTVLDHYERGLERTGKLAAELLSETTPDVAVVAGDHGEELGEQGVYFHAPYRQRVVNSLVRVPVGVRGLNAPDKLGLVDLPGEIADSVEVERPSAWDANSGRSWTLSIAPWNGDARIRLQDTDLDLRLSGTDIDSADNRVVSQQLEALGYV